MLSHPFSHVSGTCCVENTSLDDSEYFFYCPLKLWKAEQTPPSPRQRKRPATLTGVVSLVLTLYYSVFFFYLFIFPSPSKR